MTRREPSASNYGFLGVTSFASVFEEESSALKSDQTQSPSLAQFSDKDVLKGVSCLLLLKDLPRYRPLIQKWCGGATLSMISPWIPAIQSSLQGSIVDHIACASEADTNAFFLRESERIWSNSLVPIELDETCTLNGFVDHISGPNLRWETVGIYLTAVGLAVEALEYTEISNSTRDSFQTRRSLASAMLEASDLCVAMCEKAGQLTDLEAWLYWENFHLCSLTDGDASKSLTRLLKCSGLQR